MVPAADERNSSMGVVTMEVIIQPDAERASLLAAMLVAGQVRSAPASVLGLATGRTMERVYTQLIRMHREEGLDFSRCTTFNLDEYIGLSADDEHSYRHYMNHHLFNFVNIPKANTHLPDGTATDIKSACHAYEQAIRNCNGIDLQLLGIGVSGHIGFNEPLSALRSRTRDKALTPATLAQNAPMFGGDPECMPRRAITMGVGTILEARTLLVLVTGSEKASILARAVEGPITSMVSASAIQLHENCRVIVDEAAATELSGHEYYRWIYEHEPEWLVYRTLLES
jgi:glucosamine-6-phosphate deaminase